ncbi:hypothetical protein [Legionella maceachernii]|uniref:Transmembrane protein n=1 Tax=Legionella maceachernii TaxID=466 RepID=A0A0W0VYL5_9GAMM|nr:hypothetical protein [Legionella maceachernii]KTD25196.1 hypothetical protein Lmac_2174 [Legionella maceachernii]SJZ76178.1 hypothetical protein SAMN02745128_00966 [Legionella maceachernii]SUP03139.1 Uncharacterised protein [Legionella maceachernii]
MTIENETVSTTLNVGNFNAAKRISWTAIFTGAIVGVGLSFLLGLLGAAIGLSMVNMGANRMGMVALSGSIGVLISIIISMLVAGYTAGYLGRLYCPRRNLGVLYGFTTWAIILILSAVLTTHMSAYVSTYSNPASPPIVNTTGSSQSSVAPQETTASVTNPQSTSKGASNSTANPTNAPSNTATASPLTVQPSALTTEGSQVIVVRTSSSALVWGAFLVFGFFFIGALFCCLGAKWGMHCKREN